MEIKDIPIILNIIIFKIQESELQKRENELKIKEVELNEREIS